MAHYFTADTHFGDDNIRQFFGRPFRSAADMDAAMLANTARIGADDDYWHLGDFAACDSDAERANAKRIFDAIPVRKHLIRGNHDSDWIVDARLLGREQIVPQRGELLQRRAGVGPGDVVGVGTRRLSSPRNNLWLPEHGTELVDDRRLDIARGHAADRTRPAPCFSTV